MGKCAVKDCLTPVKYGDLCSRHYHKVWYDSKRKSGHKRGRTFVGRRNEFHVGVAIQKERALHREVFIDTETASYGEVL